LTGLGTATGLFSVEQGAIQNSDTHTVVFAGVSDIGQVAADTNGEKVHIDEVAYKAPTRVGCIFSLTIQAKQFPELLEAAGCLIQHFKDFNTVDVGEMAWHGAENSLVYIEPLIREPGGGITVQAMPALTLGYRLEMGINSEQGTPFKRVEKRQITGTIK
jgi:hypothetical protein